MATTKKKTTTKKSTTTKAPRKTTATRSRASATKSNTTKNSESVTVPAPTRRSIRIKRSYILTAAIVVLILIVLYAIRGWFVVAIVNGQPISRFAVISQLEEHGGKQTRDFLVVKTLIEQQGQQHHITIAQKDIDNLYKQREDMYSKQGQSLQQYLLYQGLSVADYKEQLKLELIAEKILGNNIKVSDKDVADYMAKNSASIPSGTKASDVKEQLYQQQLQQKEQTWLQDLQKNANIIYVVDYQ